MNKRGPRENSSSSTKSLILRAALHCFSQNGFDRTTTRMIAKSAGVDIALIGYHFGSKEHLWLAVIDKLCEKQKNLIIQIQNIIKNNNDVRDSLSSVVDILTNIAKEAPELLMMICNEMTSNADKSEVIQTKVIDPLINEMSPIFEKAMQSGHFPIGESRVVIFFLLGGLSQVYLTKNKINIENLLVFIRNMIK
ncbi:TetR/AcrR family transcriptional regulator [Klebsiella sp. WOUb02]|uniref:TetR/AcrR family transcriptional regulator n=1 Tax=Klebsiella sp. WOUb02 TaxID=3161071 RepID=UPI003CE926FB